jgi:hypothetical protein
VYIHETETECFIRQYKLAEVSAVLHKTDPKVHGDAAEVKIPKQTLPVIHSSPKYQGKVLFGPFRSFSKLIPFTARVYPQTCRFVVI